MKTGEKSTKFVEISSENMTATPTTTAADTASADKDNPNPANPSSNGNSAAPPLSGPGELSLYDLNRKPHVAITDNTEIVVTPRSLSSELCCPICLDLLTNTMTTKECLHRFCQECITTALLRGNKECPTCRKKLVSKRSLRPDPNFDALISKIYPDRDEYEAMQQRSMARFTRQSSTEALQKSIEIGIRAQARLRRRRVAGSYDYEKRKRRPRAQTAVPSAAGGGGDDSSASEASAATGGGGGGGSDGEIELILKPYPNDAGASVLLDQLPSDRLQLVHQHRYLKTTASATVEHLCKYLSMRVQLDAEEANRLEASPEALARLQSAPTPAPDALQFAVYVDSEGTFERLLGDCSLLEVRTRWWPHKKPLELHFRIAPVANSEATEEGLKSALEPEASTETPMEC